MDLSELDSLLQPISDEEPCGPDLEYDPEFGEMERAAQGSSEQQFGDTIVDAEPPEWKQVRKLAESLLGRTKDMRVLTHLARAKLNMEGLIAFQQAIHLLRQYLETFWDSVHPELDHDDNDDPTYRTNTLISYCDEDAILKELKDAPIVSSRAVGQFSLRDVQRAQEGDDSGEDSAVSIDTIEAAFSACEIEEIQATEEATRTTAEDFSAIEQFVTEKVGVGLAVSLAPVRSVLEEMNAFIVEQLERRGVSSGGDEADEASGEEGESEGGGGGGTSSAAGQSQPFQLAGKISSRRDAIKALDAVCEFYEEHEPSSPLPLLIRRAQRLASKSFMEILRDLAPDGLSQAEAISGAISGGAVETSSASASESSSAEASSDDSW